MRKQKILLVGTGMIAQEYARILMKLHCDLKVIGRGSENARRFTESIDLEVTEGGVESFLEINKILFDAAIVVVNIEYLSGVTMALLRHGIKRVLVEKPGGNSYAEINGLAHETERHGAQVLIAYNRRFYASVLRAKEIIALDGGVSSFNFEFTEWSHEIEKLSFDSLVKSNWLMANSSHVIDLAFYLGGSPSKLCSFSEGELAWHKPALFAGAGQTSSGALFSYQANWDAPGRWGVEVLTKRHRLIFRPIEKLQIQKRDSTEITFINIEDRLDTEFKPGFFAQTEAFLKNDVANICTISEQKQKYENVYSKILGL